MPGQPVIIIYFSIVFHFLILTSAEKPVAKDVVLLEQCADLPAPIGKKACLKIIQNQCTDIVRFHAS